VHDLWGGAMKRKPRIYKSNLHGTMPWIFQAGMEMFTFRTWEDAAHFARWYVQPEATA
jgi:hypothetical protein